MAEDEPNVEVITDSQQVAAARRAYADAQEARFLRALEQPERLPYEHHDVLYANVPRDRGIVTTSRR